VIYCVSVIFKLVYLQFSQGELVLHLVLELELMTYC